MKDRSETTAQQTARQDDRQLIAACLDGRQDAWEILITRYQRLIYSIPLKMRLSTDDAADIFQAVCLILLESLASLRDHEKLSSWLITTTTRESWRVARERRRESTPLNEEGEEDTARLNLIPDPQPLADEQRIALEQQQALRDGIAALSERCRELITLLFYRKDELSYADIARRMRMPVASLGPTRARCLEKLKKLLQGKL